MDIAQYPQYLIPQTVWRKHMCVDEMLSDMDDFCVLRRIDCSEEMGIDYSLVEGGGSPFLTHKALSDSSIANMSMSLLGTPFQKNDIKFTNLNYWHYTLDVSPADREAYIDEPQNSSEKKMLKKVGNQYLRYTFRRYEPEDTIPQVKESLWIK